MNIKSSDIFESNYPPFQKIHQRDVKMWGKQYSRKIMKITLRERKYFNGWCSLVNYDRQFDGLQAVTCI